MQQPSDGDGWLGKVHLEPAPGVCLGLHDLLEQLLKLRLMPDGVGLGEYQEPLKTDGLAQFFPAGLVAGIHPLPDLLGGGELFGGSDASLLLGSPRSKSPAGFGEVAFAPHGMKPEELGRLGVPTLELVEDLKRTLAVAATDVVAHQRPKERLVSRGFVAVQTLGLDDAVLRLVSIAVHQHDVGTLHPESTVHEVPSGAHDQIRSDQCFAPVILVDRTLDIVQRRCSGPFHLLPPMVESAVELIYNYTILLQKKQSLL